MKSIYSPARADVKTTQKPVAGQFDGDLFSLASRREHYDNYHRNECHCVVVNENGVVVCSVGEYTSTCNGSEQEDR
jgi:hypothetical protein